jgi:hypothetical protein
VAISTDGKATLWTPDVLIQNGKDVYGDHPVHRYANAAWTKVAGIDGAFVAGDPEDAAVFYAYKRKDGDFYKSTDNGVTFSKVSTPGVSEFKKFRLAPNRTGDIWIPLTKEGLSRSTDGGTTFTKISTVSYCEAVGFGKAATGKTFPAVYIFGTVDGVTGVFQSIDEGASWVRINDDRHEYGGLANGEFIVGDMNTFGVVYMSTAGRGIACRLPGAGPSGFKNINSLLKTQSDVRIKGTTLTVTAQNKESVIIQVYSLRGELIYTSTVTGTGTIHLQSVVKTSGTFIVKVRNRASVWLLDTFKVIK